MSATYFQMVEIKIRKRKHSTSSKMLAFGNLSEENSLYYSCNFSETLKVCQKKKKFYKLCYERTAKALLASVRR